MIAWPDLTVYPIDRAAGAVRLPGSKSISNRVLLLSALADSTTTLADLLDADDVRAMRDSLAKLGVELNASDEGVQVGGCGGRFPVREASLFLGNAGTAFRSLTAALAFSGGRYELDGTARMRERPIGDLVDALNSVGACVRYSGSHGFPPLVIEPADCLSTDHVSIKGNVSSQFLSGVLMAAPLIAPDHGLRISVDGTLISQPYVELTLSLMKQFGVRVVRDGNAYRVPRVSYRSPGVFFTEGDASSASYFLALGAIARGPVTVGGVGKDSVQGDVRFADLLAGMGAQVDFAAHHIR